MNTEKATFIKRAIKVAVSTLMITVGLNGTLVRAEQAGNHKAYVYTELQISAPFNKVPWQDINKAIKQHSGFRNKTWLAGVGNNSAGGFYAFDTIGDAQKFVTTYFQEESAKFGVAHTTRIFNAEATANASREINSVYYDGKIKKKPGAFVYTELQLNVTPFDKAAPWRKRNPVIKTQKGLLSKTWLSGFSTGTIGGFYAFDTIENAKNFAIIDFPKSAKKLNAALYTRIFDARLTEAASKDMHSPFYQ